MFVRTCASVALAFIAAAALMSVLASFDGFLLTEETARAEARAASSTLAS
jgi:hypothetical protein